MNQAPPTQPARSLSRPLVIALGVVLGQNMFPKSTANRKIQMYGSRFSPVAGASVQAAPSHPMALEDRPVQGTVPTT